MNNKYLKSAIISSAIAVVTGVLLFGINATFGAPTYDPNGSESVKPTFTGINVTGDIVNPGGDVKVNDNLAVSGFGNIVGNLLVTAKGSFTGGVVTDNIYNKTATAVSINAPLNANGKLTLSGDLDANGLITNSVGDVTIDDNLTVNKKLSVIGDFITNKATTVTLGDQTSSGTTIYMGGGIQMIGNLTRFIAGLTSLRGSDGTLVITSSKTGDTSASSASLALSPSSKTATFSTKYITSNTGTPLEVLGGLKVSIALDVTNIKNSAGTVSMDSPLTVNGSVSASSLKLPSDNGSILNGNLNPILQTWWSALFGDYTAINSGYAWDTVSEPVSLVAGTNGVFFTKGSGGTAYKTVLGKVDLNGHMTAVGGFGKISQYNSVAVNIGAGLTGSASASCSSANEKLLSCGAVLGGWGYVNTIQPNYAASSCTAYAKNTEATAKTLTATAICIDPTL